MREVRTFSEVSSTVQYGAHGVSQNRIGEGAPSSAGPPSTAAAANLSPAVSSISEWRSITCLTGMIKVFLLVVMAEELRKSADAMSMITLLPKTVSGDIDNAHRQTVSQVQKTCSNKSLLSPFPHHFWCSSKAMPTQTRLGVQSAQPGSRLVGIQPMTTWGRPLRALLASRWLQVDELALPLPGAMGLSGMTMWRTSYPSNGSPLCIGGLVGCHDLAASQ